MVTTFVVKFVRSRRLFTIKCRNQQSSVSGSPLRSKFSAFHFISYYLIKSWSILSGLKTRGHASFSFWTGKVAFFLEIMYLLHGRITETPFAKKVLSDELSSCRFGGNVLPFLFFDNHQAARQL